MLHFETLGTGPDKLVLLHGFMEDSSIWQEMELTLQKEFSIIKIDLPGHGKSKNSVSEISIEYMAMEVKQVLEFLQIPRIKMLGHSMGGYVTLAFAKLFPEMLSDFCLFFSNTFADSEDKKEIRQRSLKIINENFDLFVNTSIPNLFSEMELDKLESKIEIAKKIAISTNKEAVKYAQKAMMNREDSTMILEKWKGKILIIAGKYDNAVKTDQFLSAIPKKTNIKTYILDCGHNGHWEKPLVCASIILTEMK